MKYSILAETYRKLDATTKRLEMIDILIDLFNNTKKDVFRKVVYLTSGKIGADYINLEMGFADRMVIKAIAKAIGKSESVVSLLYKQKGDLGVVAEELIEKSGQQSIGVFFGEGNNNDKSSSLDINEIWEVFHKIVTTEGKGSNDKKINLLIGLFSKATPLEAKYLTRTVLSQLRLGIKDLTIIEAFARKFGDKKEAREIIEHAYNITCDIGEVGEILAYKGLSGVENITIKVGRPIRMMAAQRMASIEEILEKMGGQCALEFKYDGERVQAHIFDRSIIMYSRNLNDITNMYPDVKEALRKAVNSNNVIIEGEITAWDPETEKLKPFQILMSRKRKYDIEKMMQQIPVRVFLFDILYINGESLLDKSYPDRRKRLEAIIQENDKIVTSSRQIVNSIAGFESYFEYAIENGCEGVMAKDIRKETPYQAGNRGFLWIKHKFDYSEAFADSFDLVVVGGFYGKGRRKGTLGTLLMATFNSELERYETICKLGSGFTDEDLIKITEEFMAIKVDKKPKDVYSKMEPDVWIEPLKVMEIQGADLSTSPIHTCAIDEIDKDTGIAIRFPRFIRFRDDKGPEDATTTSEIVTYFKGQRLQK